MTCTFQKIHTTSNDPFTVVASPKYKLSFPSIHLRSEKCLFISFSFSATPTSPIFYYSISFLQTILQLIPAKLYKANIKLARFITFKLPFPKQYCFLIFFSYTKFPFCKLINNTAFIFSTTLFCETTNFGKSKKNSSQ